MWNTKHNATVFHWIHSKAQTHSHTFTYPAARGCRSGLISVAMTLIGACVPWLCVSLEYHAEAQPLPSSLPFTLAASPHPWSAFSLSPHHTSSPLTPCVCACFSPCYNVNFHLLSPSTCGAPYLNR